METTPATAVTIEALRAQCETGKLDRMAGQAIQTKSQFKELHQALTYSEFEDLYRAYCAGYRGNR
jgi:hypothetical protein